MELVLNLKKDIHDSSPQSQVRLPHLGTDPQGQSNCSYLLVTVSLKSTSLDKGINTINSRKFCAARRTIFRIISLFNNSSKNAAKLTTHVVPITTVNAIPVLSQYLFSKERSG